MNQKSKQRIEAACSFFYKRYGINSMNLPDKRKKNIKKLHKLKHKREKEKNKNHNLHNQDIL